MAILVCGGAGYIGSHTVAELLENNEKVVTYDSLVKGHRKAVIGGEFVQGDIKDAEKLMSVFKRYDIEAVINFTAFIEAGESVRDPLKYYANNVSGCVTLLSAMREAGVKKIVFSSSAAVYGDPLTIPITETDRLVPINPYGETKLVVEKMLRWTDVAYGNRYIALRYFNAAGAHKNGSLGEDHDPETHLIPTVLLGVLRKKEGLKIFGGDYETKDGTCVRDYIHVSDLAQAHYRALTRLREIGVSGAYNLGNGKGFSNKQIVETASEVTGIKIRYEIVDRRAGDPAVLVASSDKAREELGWRPRYPDLNEIIASAWKWHKNNPDGYSG